MPTNDEIKVETKSALTELDRRVMRQRERLDGCTIPATWGQWLDTQLHYGSGSAPWAGALLALVREAWKDDKLTAQWASAPEWSPIWIVWTMANPAGAYAPVEVARGETEAEVLVSALEAAPAA